MENSKLISKEVEHYIKHEIDQYFKSIIDEHLSDLLKIQNHLSRKVTILENHLQPNAVDWSLVLEMNDRISKLESLEN